MHFHLGREGIRVAVKKKRSRCIGIAKGDTIRFPELVGGGRSLCDIRIGICCLVSFLTSIHNAIAYDFYRSLNSLSRLLYPCVKVEKMWAPVKFIAWDLLTSDLKHGSVLGSPVWVVTKLLETVVQRD